MLVSGAEFISESADVFSAEEAELITDIPVQEEPAEEPQEESLVVADEVPEEDDVEGTPEVEAEEVLPEAGDAQETPAELFDSGETSDGYVVPDSGYMGDLPFGSYTLEVRVGEVTGSSEFSVAHLDESAKYKGELFVGENTIISPDTMEHPEEGPAYYKFVPLETGTYRILDYKSIERLHETLNGYEQFDDSDMELIGGKTYYFGFYNEKWVDDPYGEGYYTQDFPVKLLKVSKVTSIEITDYSPDPLRFIEKLRSDIDIKSGTITYDNGETIQFQMEGDF